MENMSGHFLFYKQQMTVKPHMMSTFLMDILRNWQVSPAVRGQNLDMDI